MDYHIEEIRSKETWEAHISKYSGYALFQSWLWGDVQKSTGTEVWRLGVYEHTTLIGIAQVCKIKAKRGWFLHIRHGPILQKQTASYWKECMQFLRVLAKKEHAWFIRVSPLLSVSDNTSHIFTSLGFKPAPIHAMDAELCWVLDIGIPEEELLLGMRKTTRYEIRRAEKLGVRVDMSTNPDDLKKFFHLYEETSKRHNFVPHKGIFEEFSVFAKEKQAVLLIGSHEKTVLAGALVLFYGDEAIYHHGASINTKIPASYVVQWEAIKEAKKRGMKLYNFWGIADENNINHPWNGITLFKKGFGGNEMRYIHAQDLPISPLYVLPKAVETVRRRIKGY